MCCVLFTRPKHFAWLLTNSLLFSFLLLFAIEIQFIRLAGTFNRSSCSPSPCYHIILIRLIYEDAG